jgi:serine/threonine protein kinase
VALKLFKGGITSDGLPQCEMAAALHAGQHAGLITLLGQLSGHPQARQGLVMAQMPDGFGNLAQPPSLASCTRDVYPPDRRFTLPVVLRIASTVAGVMQQLHQRGMLHGDLYGHNVLYRPDGETLLSDFGAASFYDPGQANAAALQQIDVRAFGYLLQELLAHCHAEDAARPTLTALAALQAACLSPQPAQRPLFADIVCTLVGIGAP